jgi:hypothetical protein
MVGVVFSEWVVMREIRVNAGGHKSSNYYSMGTDSECMVGR